MNNLMKRIEETQRRFYLNKSMKHRNSPKSLSWNNKKSQNLRFQKIVELFKYEKLGASTIHEVGCGLAHFKDYLDDQDVDCIYSGSDIITEFIDKNMKKYPECDFFLQNIAEDYNRIPDDMKGKDYYCLSGTFHTKENNSEEEWKKFITVSIENMFRMAKRGVCFNFLTKHSDYYDEKLYYEDPRRIMGWCLKNLSRFVSVSHDIPLYEFFVYVYKEEFIKSRFPEYKKYFQTRK